MMKMGMNNIRNRILIFFLAIILIPIMTLGVLANTVYSRSIEKKANEHTVQMINQIQNNIEYYLQSVDNIIYYISQTPEVVEYITMGESISESTDTEMKVRRSLSVYREANPEILAILIVNNKDQYLSNELEKNNRDPLLIQQWYTDAINNPDQTKYFSKPVGRNISTYLQHSEDEVISVSRTMRHPITNKIIGVVLIDINLNKFEEIIKDNYIGQKGFFYILDKNNDIVYCPINPIIYRIKSEWLKGDISSTVQTINNETFKIMFETSSQTGWKTIGVFSIKDILEDVISMKNFAIIISSITFVLAIIAAIIFTTTIVTPVKELKELMKRAEQGDLDVYFEDGKYNDEFEELGHSFNHMIKEIKQLINMVYKEQRSKRKAEIKILQAQIKPHFLYNTLDTIHWMAQDYGAKDIVEIVEALTNVFRIGLSKGRETIKVSEELEHIKSYMIIQKARYEDKLEYAITCDDSLHKTLMLKLTTQPIVENAIYHGIKQKRGVGTVEIEITKLNNKLLIRVKDNGAGMDADKLYEINGMLESDTMNTITSKTGSGYGIYNVHSRIRMTYGNEYGLKYFSQVNEGTEVQIWLPILQD